MNIYLLGYMGSGKSTVGKALAEALEYDFLDFDHYISNNEGMTIAQIFEQKGEIYFRKKEIHYLDQLISENRTNVIIALGGGTPCYANNMEKILQTGDHSIYLNVPFKKIAQRLWEDRGERPLVNNISDYELLEDYVRKHLFERAYFYNQASQVIKVSDDSSQQIVEKIIANLF